MTAFSVLERQVSFFCNEPKLVSIFTDTAYFQNVYLLFWVNKFNITIKVNTVIITMIVLIKLSENVQTFVCGYDYD